jgi:hypothetical protein
MTALVCAESNTRLRAPHAINQSHPLAFVSLKKTPSASITKSDSSAIISNTTIFAVARAFTVCHKRIVLTTADKQDFDTVHERDCIPE